MHRLSLALKYYVHLRLNNDPGWRDITVWPLFLYPLHAGSALLGQADSTTHAVQKQVSCGASGAPVIIHGSLKCCEAAPSRSQHAAAHALAYMRVGMPDVDVAAHVFRR